MLVVRKYSTIFALSLAFFFAIGVACAPIVLANQTQLEQCCDSEPSPDVPAEKDECFDCNCLSCVVATSTPAYNNKRTILAMSPSWLFSKNLPSGFIRSIDYPPEVL